MRKISECMNCHEELPIVAFGLCNKCYQHEVYHGPDRHSSGIRREQRKLFKGLASIMCGLSDLGVSRVETKEIRAMLEPYLKPIREFLTCDPKLARNSRDQVEENQEVVSLNFQNQNSN